MKNYYDPVISDLIKEQQIVEKELFKNNI